MAIHVVFFSFIITIISGCVPQYPAPIEYNYNETSNSRQSNHQLLKPHISKHTKINEIIKGDEDKIISKPLDERSQDFDKPTGFLKEPKINSDKDIDDIIVVPQTKQDNNQIIYHEVQKNETLRSIANNYNQTIEALAELNDLSIDSQLSEFQIIKIRVSTELLNKKNKETIIKSSDDSQVNRTNNTSFISPVVGKVIIEFGEKTSHGKNGGINIAASEGSNIKSIASGIVVYAGYNVQFGNLLIIKLDNTDLYVAYAHLQDLIVQKGDIISQGEIIGHVGHTGNVEHSQLHFAIREGKIAVDPFKYIKKSL